MSSSTLRKRRRDEKNANTPARPPTTPRDPFRTPLTARQPHDRSLLFPLLSEGIPPIVQSLSFCDGFKPTPPLKKCLSAIYTPPEEVERMRKEHALKEKEHSKKQREIEEEKQQALHTAGILFYVDSILKVICANGLKVHEFRVLEKFLTTRDPSLSSQASKMLINHGPAIFDAARCRQPEVANDWVLSTVRQLIEKQSEVLAAHLRPRQGSSVTEILHKFSLREFLLEAERIAPTVYQTLRQIGVGQNSENSKHKDRKLILATVLCMLTKSRNEHSTPMQTTMCMYLLACSTSRSLFDVLDHAEHLAETRVIARFVDFLLIWDNINFAFNVVEQRHDSKDHFDNGTTATLVLLFKVVENAPPLALKPPRTNHIPILNFTAADLLPNPEEAARVQDGQLWHIKDILFDAFPNLRKRFAHSILPPPVGQQVPVHKTEQYPLPAMHINESSLEGTLHLLKTIFCDSLQLTEDDIRRKGVVICAGDHLSLSLLDKISAIRCDDTNLMDNVRRYTEGRTGLLHVKFAHARMVANEYWGKPNSKSPWLLWKVNTLLGRKPISAGLKAKSLPPFRPFYELILNLTLPANILDAFRIYCPLEDLDEWVTSVSNVTEIDVVARQILDELCSGRRVEQLRRATRRDVPFENICLFNRDGLHLCQFKHAVKCGDVGVVLDLIKRLMLAFRGTGQNPKYADALFQIVVNLRNMDPELCNRWLNNWLANLSGKENGFKEMDLLQEHQNFWLKVQQEFSTPFNSNSHTSPSMTTDVKVLCDYLQAQQLQEFQPTRENNDDAMEARDLIQAGATYANRPTAFRNFTYTKFKTRINVADADNTECVQQVSSVDELIDELIDSDDGPDFPQYLHPGNLAANFDELLHDEDEYPVTADAKVVTIRRIQMFGDYLVNMIWSVDTTSC
ncbi:hypothetical protein BDN70DRAFT_915054 [Pholiota conissans]|uniref:DUF6589 domain-containing protein n=1 Tax=Pholiota conissans TaxID=109636 RepID=A0A9P5YV34_9AGAR|nr:hypothetical protein BDN70DRAFT_915054 [Pholiota conissans]